MNLTKLIVGLLVLILFSLVTLVFVGDWYNTNNLDVDMSADKYTQSLSNLSEQVNQSQTEIQESNAYLKDRMAGGDEVDLDKDASESALLAGGVTALTQIPSYLGISFNLIAESTGVLRLNSLFVWFFVAVIMITIAIIVISSVLRNRL